MTWAFKSWSLLEKKIVVGCRGLVGRGFLMLKEDKTLRMSSFSYYRLFLIFHRSEL